MPEIGKGVSEIRIWNSDGTYRVIYTAKFAEAVYVLHTFQKKTEQTAKKDKDLAKKRLNELIAQRKKK